ncbi:MAG TPA: heavy metal translocating P-type ATPase metal-binding domain-containing protein, partial [Methylomirabilota bacterium]|nr:heavy metal translocating P-type ATPase metal-binding domain-containing protein [Methylomirabilota bacterium]
MESPANHGNGGRPSSPTTGFILISIGNRMAMRQSTLAGRWTFLAGACPAQGEAFARNVQLRAIDAKPPRPILRKLRQVNGTGATPSIHTGETGGTSPPAAARSASPQSSAAEERCHHCGQPCADRAVVEQGLPFCCQGCRAVFTLLTECGLGGFYSLAPAPGTRVRETTRRREWAFLDDPGVREKLLDFADERQARVTLYIPAIHCVACVWLLENLFRLNPGVGESKVNFPRREVSVTFDPARLTLGELVALLASLGYEPELTQDALQTGGTEGTTRRAQRQWLQLGVAGFGFGNVMLLALPGYLGLDSLSGPWFRVLAGWLGLALALPVLVYSAADYWRAAWFSIRERMVTLDVPIAIGLAAIYGRSVFEVASGR